MPVDGYQGISLVCAYNLYYILKWLLYPLFFEASVIKDGLIKIYITICEGISHQQED